MDPSEAFPDELPAQYDAVIIHDPDDVDRVQDFCTQLTDMLGSEDVRVTMFGCEEMVAGQLRFCALEDVVKRSTLMFLFMTKPFCEVRANVVLAAACLTEMLNNERKRWCLIPIWTEPRNYSPSMNVSSLSGFPERLQSKFRKDSLIKLFKEKRPLRMQREQEQQAQREQLARAARDRQQKEEEREHKENLQRLQEQHKEQMRSNERRAELEQLHVSHAMERELATRGTSPAAVLLTRGDTANGTFPGSISSSVAPATAGGAAVTVPPYTGMMPVMSPYGIAYGYPPVTSTAVTAAGGQPAGRAAPAAGAAASATAAAAAAIQLPAQWPRPHAQMAQPAAAAPLMFVQAWPEPSVPPGPHSNGMPHYDPVMGANQCFADWQRWPTPPVAAGAVIGGGCAYWPYPGADTSAIRRLVDASAAAAAATAQLHHSSSDGRLQQAAQAGHVLGPRSAAEAIGRRLPVLDPQPLPHGPSAYHANAAACHTNATTGLHHAEGSAAMQPDTSMKQLQQQQPDESPADWKPTAEPLHDTPVAQESEPPSDMKAKLLHAARDLSAHRQLIENVGDRQQALLNDCIETRITSAAASGSPVSGGDGHVHERRQGLPPLLPQQEAWVYPGGPGCATGPQWVTATVGEETLRLIRPDSRDVLSGLPTFVRGMQLQDVSASFGSGGASTSLLTSLPPATTVASAQCGRPPSARTPYSHEQERTLSGSVDCDLAARMLQMQHLQGFRAPAFAQAEWAWPVYQQQMSLFAVSAAGTARGQAGAHLSQSHSVPGSMHELTARAAAQPEQLDGQHRSTTSREDGSSSILVLRQNISGGEETSCHPGDERFYWLPSIGSPQHGSSLARGWSVCDTSLQQGETNDVGLAQPGQLNPSNATLELSAHGLPRRSEGVRGSTQLVAPYDSHRIAAGSQEESFDVLLATHLPC